MAREHAGILVANKISDSNIDQTIGKIASVKNRDIQNTIVAVASNQLIKDMVYARFQYLCSRIA